VSLKCAKSQVECDWCGDSWYCEIREAYKRLEVEERRRKWHRYSSW